MRTASRNVAAHVARSGLLGEQSDRAQENTGSLTLRLKQSYVTLAKLKQALVASERQSVRLRQQVEELTEVNAQLRRELTRLLYFPAN